MANKGTLTCDFTNWNSFVFSWNIDKQSVEGNYSTIKWSVVLNAGSSGRIDSDVGKTLTVNIGGRQSTHTVYININNNTTKTLASGSVTISHASDGTKTIDISAKLEIGITFSGGSIGTKTVSKENIQLDAIPRLAAISMSDGGYLGVAQTITVTNLSSGFTHSISYKCGSKTGTVCTSSTSTSVSFTPPLNLATANVTGKSVSVMYTITTYNGSSSIGSKSISVTHKMSGSDFSPDCSISISDVTGYYQTYGNYLMGLSKIKIEITATAKHGASISSYSATADGGTYTTASFTILPKTSGTKRISVTVTDSRGFFKSAIVSISVLDYVPPNISKLTVHRANQDGTENNQGEYVKVTFSAAVAELNGENTAQYRLRYKKSSDTAYTSDVELTAYKNTYVVTDGNTVFPADTGSSYDVEIVVTDKYGTTARSTSASTAFTLMHFKADGTGVAFGKISEIENLVDFGLPVRFMAGILSPCLEAETDLNDVKSPGTYTGENVATYNYSNCPVNNGTFTLLVESGGEDGQVKQTYTTCSKYKPEKFSRFYYQGEWGNWWSASSDEVVLYENESGSNGTITLWASASHYRYLEIYYTDNNGKTGGYTKVWNPNGKNVCLHIQEPTAPIYSRQTLYSISGTSMTPDTENATYVKFSGTLSVITSISTGTNYIKVVRVIGRA